MPGTGKRLRPSFPSISYGSPRREHTASQSAPSPHPVGKHHTPSYAYTIPSSMAIDKSRHLKALFLERYRLHGNVSQACREVEIETRTLVYDWRTKDLAFSAAWDEAEVEATEHLETEARRRAVDGLVRKKFDPKGNPLVDPETGQQYTERDYSDTLLIFLLKARAPEKYRERWQGEVHVSGAVQHQVTGRLDLRVLTNADLELLEQLYARQQAQIVDVTPTPVSVEEP